MEIVTLGLIALLAVFFAGQPATSVVLLPDQDGSTGALVVKTQDRQEILSGAYGSAVVDKRGALALRTEAPAEVAQRYASTLDARPAAPVSFVLHFEFGSAVDIAPSFAPVLEQLRAALPRYPAPEVTVIGHTDRVGSQESNDQLSLQRAMTVRDLLLQAGLPPDSIEVAGRGEREPEVPTADEVPEAKNRRVEVNLR